MASDGGNLPKCNTALAFISVFDLAVEPRREGAREAFRKGFRETFREALREPPCKDMIELP